MTRLPMSPTAAALLRALIARAAIPRDRILLSAVRSTDWQSLTFTGEQHRMLFHLRGPDAEQAYRRLVADLENAEFSIRGQIVADIHAERRLDDGADGIGVAIEALTIAE